MTQIWYVYWLRAPMLHNQIVWTGCSINPKSRCKDFTRQFRMVLTMTKSKSYVNHLDAKARETDELRKHWPTLFNCQRTSNIPQNAIQVNAKRIATMNSPEGKKRNSDAQRRPDLQVQRAVSAGKRFKDKPLSREHRKKIGAALTGSKHTPEHRDHNREAQNRPDVAEKRRLKSVGRKFTKKHKASIKRALNRPEVREMIRIKLTGRKRTPDQRARIATAQRSRRERERNNDSMQYRDKSGKFATKHRKKERT